MSKNTPEYQPSLMMYLMNMLVETLPSEQKNEAVLEGFSLKRQGEYVILQLLLSNGFRELIHSLPESEATAWKESLRQVLTDHISCPGVHVLGMLNLQPMVRTFVVHLDTAEDMTCLQAGLESLDQVLRDTYKTSVTGCIGSVVHDFFDLGRSYKQARMLHGYHYIIGLGKSAVYQDFNFSEDYSLIEYKFLHLYEKLLSEADWQGVYDLLNKIKTTLIDKTINDSKTAYIYKEIYSMTIRYLLRQEDQPMEATTVLNEGIINFDSLFDDIEDIHHYYVEVFQTISHESVEQGTHPYVKKMLNMIHSEYQNPISLEEIADRLSVSNAYLSRLFKKEVNTGFKHYLSHVRIEQAKKLLTETDLSINTIRDQVGYQTPTQFVRAFKQSEGMPPTQYRKFHQ